MPDSILPSLTPTGAPARAPRRLTRSTLVLLIGLQLLLALTVAAGVWATSAHLRRLALEALFTHKSRFVTTATATATATAPPTRCPCPARRLQQSVFFFV